MSHLRTSKLPLFWAVVLLARIATASEPVDFDRDIRPLLSNTCYTCHGPDANKREADLRFDDKASVFAARDGNAIVLPGQPEKSELIRRVTSTDPDERMPPPDAGQQLSAAQVQLLEQWITEGAPWQQHWSFARLVRPQVPAVAHSDWTQLPLDAFVSEVHEQRGLPHSPAATRETLIRRVTLDLTGLPPTLAEIDAFLADRSPQAYEKVVDRLFQSSRYGEHMALAWLEAARYADSNGYQQDRTRTMWPWRDWVIHAMNNNMPFDEFTVLQIAGDLLPDAGVEQYLPTGFHRNHMLNGEGGRIAEESRVNYVFDRVDTTATVWLGLTMGCARCHDHKYDPISQQDFYRMFAYFNNIDESGAVDAGGNAKPVMKVPTLAQLEEVRALTAELTRLDDTFQQIPTSAELRAWEAEQVASLAEDAQPYWHLASPVSMASENGQTMAVQGDGTILVTGKNPENDNYELVFRTNLRGITGMRLEAVPHAAFTNGAFARSNSGNFVLTHIDLEGARIAAAKADFEQGNWTVERSYDGNSATGWAVWTGNGETMRQHRNAVYQFEKPLAGDALTLRMKHETSHQFHNLSSFRIYFTTRPEPRLDGKAGLPDLVLSALQTPAEKRNSTQTNALRAYFRETAPSARDLKHQIAAVEKKRSELEKSFPEAMVMRERAAPRETYRLERGAWDQPDKSQPLYPTLPAGLQPLP